MIKYVIQSKRGEEQWKDSPCADCETIKDAVELKRSWDEHAVKTSNGRLFRVVKRTIKDEVIA